MEYPKIQPLLNNKCKIHQLSYVYKGVCCSGADYAGETMRNVNIRLNDHESGIDKNSKFFKQLQEHSGHDLEWSVLSIAPKIL